MNKSNKTDALIYGVRGQPAADRKAVIDINPVIVNLNGAVAVDTLVVLN